MKSFFQPLSLARSTRRVRADRLIALLLLAAAVALASACGKPEPAAQAAPSLAEPTSGSAVDAPAGEPAEFDEAHVRLEEALAAEAAANEAAAAALAEREALLEAREELLRKEEELQARQARVAAQKAEADRRAQELAVRAKQLDNHEADLSFQERELRDREAALDEIDQLESPDGTEEATFRALDPDEDEIDPSEDELDPAFDTEPGLVADDEALPSPTTRQASLQPGRLLEIEILETLTTRTNRVGDTFEARLIQDLKAEDGTLVVPAGTEVVGRVTRVEPLKTVGGQAALEIEFTHLVLSPTESLAISASFVEVGVDRRKDKKKIAGAAIVGAILGRVLGGDTEAVIGGAAAGAAAGTAAVARAKGKDAEIPAGEIVALQLEEVVTVTVEMKGPAPD